MVFRNRHDGHKTYTVATICPLGDGSRLPGPYDVMSLMNPERYGENVNNDAMKYATAHLRILR